MFAIRNTVMIMIEAAGPDMTAGAGWGPDVTAGAGVVPHGFDVIEDALAQAVAALG